MRTPDRVTRVVRDTIQRLGRETLCHPPFSFGFTPFDYHCFHSLDNHLRGKCFTNEADLRQTDFFASEIPSFAARGLHR
ncbi:hypothetical protein NPIL_581081 [Nephila pilipes]|uniref:Histone-lysine N-methyltransferase SETMAR n=1 Tax=Nephila pilipes TaxID=299642 RepID=A0A8X6T3V5_NEPPI|nr:hypothetical protein NPIL_581081 [Nephila pilipes]